MWKEEKKKKEINWLMLQHIGFFSSIHTYLYTQLADIYVYKKENEWLF